MLTGIKKIHFIGIGGIGMSALALLLLKRGYTVSGSDLKTNRLTEEIKKRGGRVSIGHRASNISKGTQLIVYSTSINEKNPEMINARKKDIPIVHRSDILAELSNSSVGISITGAHGKTTTTALSAFLLTSAGFDPTVILGGEADFLGGNWRDGKGDYVVCEADESDGTFLKMRPHYAILTNIDEEHMEYYRDLNEIIEANKTFMENIKSGGCLITSYDNVHIKKLLKRYKRRFLTYASGPVPARSAGVKKPDIYPKRISVHKGSSSFEAVFRGKNLGVFKINMPGRHNIENSLAVILLGLEMGIDLGVINRSLYRYSGTLRRFQIKGCIDDIMVIEDYAHHPREIAATVSACKSWPNRRIIGVFQPHRYTRTGFLKDAFGKSFLGVDKLILTDIYSASERPIKGVDSGVIYEEVINNGHKNVCLIRKKKILPHLLENLKRNDTVLFLGAGDIGELSDELIKRLRAKGQDLT